MFATVPSAEQWQVKSLVRLAEAHTALRETEQAIKHLESALELGLATDMIQERLAVLRNGNQSEAEKLADKHGIPIERVEEGLKAKKMMDAIPRLPKAGSKWYALDMEWVKQWQEYIYFDLLTDPGSTTVVSEEAEMPGPLDWDLISKPVSKKRIYFESHKDHAWQNVELKDNLRENDDFLLVTEEVFKYAESVYGLRGRPVIRYGIEQADGETCVELYLKSLNILPVPSSIFKITEAKSLLISRAATLSNLKQKLLRSLNTLLYEQGNKSTTFNKVRLWKISGDIESLEKR